MPAKHDGRSLYVAFERNGRRMSRGFSLEQHMADFILFIASINTVFFVEHIEGAFFYILENFEEFLLISGRENALRVTRNVDIPCRNLHAIIQPSPLKTGELPFSVRSAKYYFKIRCSNGCFFSTS